MRVAQIQYSHSMQRRLSFANARRAAPIAAILLAGVAALLLLAFPSTSSPRPTPGVWLALVLPVDPSNPLEGQVRAVNTATGDEVDLGAPGDWFSLSWSPDGRYLYATQVLRLGSSDDSAVTIRPTIFDVPSRRIAASATWPFDDCRHGADRASWAPDGNRVALPGQHCAAVLGIDGHFELTRLIAPASGGGLTPVWAPDSSRFAYRAGGREAVIVDRSASESLLIRESAWPTSITGPAAWQPDRFSWVSSAVLLVHFQTYPDPRNGNEQTGEPHRFWSAEGQFTNNQLTWSPRQEVDPSTYFPVLPDTEALLDGHTLEDEVPYRRLFSDDLQFAAAVPAPPGAAIVGNAEFVTMIDGQRFTYPLGAGYIAREAFEFTGKWDMVRVD